MSPCLPAKHIRRNREAVVSPQFDSLIKFSSVGVLLRAEIETLESLDWCFFLFRMFWCWEQWEPTRGAGLWSTRRGTQSIFCPPRPLRRRFKTKITAHYWVRTSPPLCSVWNIPNILMIPSAGPSSITAAAKCQFTDSFVSNSKGKIVILHVFYFFVLKSLNLNLHVNINV